MGNHRARGVRFRLLRQMIYFLSYGKTIYSEDGPQESRISQILRFQKWFIGEYYFQSSVFSSITSRAFKMLWLTVMSLWWEFPRQRVKYSLRTASLAFLG